MVLLKRHENFSTVKTMTMMISTTTDSLHLILSQDIITDEGISILEGS